MHFVLKISKLCNLRCTYCYEYEELGSRERMPLEDLDTFFSTIPDWYRRAGGSSTLTFVLHGGEPLLLPDAYLREFVASLRQNLLPAEVPFRVSLQTNLTRIDAQRIGLLEELDISLGVSLDVFGGERIDLAGRDSQPQVLDNLQRLFDLGAVERLGVGAISVLHAGNVAHAVPTFEFYRQLGLSYRILPVFSLTDPPARMRHLPLAPEQVVEAFKAVARAQFAADSSILVIPLVNYLQAAVSHLSGIEATVYDPELMEWALIVNTNGAAYNHAEAYAPEGLLGNIFTDSLTAILQGQARRRLNELRLERATTCDACRFGRNCSRIPLIEALPSERFMDDDGKLRCAITEPLIDFMVKEIEKDPAAHSLTTTQPLALAASSL